MGFCLLEEVEHGNEARPKSENMFLVTLVRLSMSSSYDINSQLLAGGICDMLCFHRVRSVIM